MQIAPTGTTVMPPAVVRRVNQLYHDLTQATFDVEHAARHRVERAFWQDAAARVATTAGSRTVVDLACGTGFVTTILGSALHAGDRVIGIDVSSAALTTTTRKYQSVVGRDGAALTTLNCDGAALPLADGSVDLFAINAALHHMPEPGSVLGEVDRVLRPGGLFALGFEPNKRHFASAMSALSRGFDRLVWYASPRQNVRRLSTRLGGSPCGAPGSRHVASVIRDTLVREQLVSNPLCCETVMDLVDPHARGAEQAAGFNPIELMSRHFPSYAALRLLTSDYLGEAPRRCRPFRMLVDASLRTLLPAHGSLFSWILRKPVHTEQGGVRS